MDLLNDPFRLVEDDRLRSRYVRELVRETAPMDAPSDRANIPKVIVQFWHDSHAIPADVCECLDSWEAPSTSSAVLANTLRGRGCSSRIRGEPERPYDSVA